MVVTKMSQCHGVTTRVETKMTPMTKFPTQTTIFPTNVTVSQMSQSRVETASTQLSGQKEKNIIKQELSEELDDFELEIQLKIWLVQGKKRKKNQSRILKIKTQMKIARSKYQLQRVPKSKRRPL
jgi:hypothetical protein